MTMFDKYDHDPLFTFNAPEDADWYKLSDLVKRDGTGKVYPLKAMYINNKGKFGPNPVLITEHELVSAPEHLTNDVEDMLGRPELVQYINEGHAGFSIYEYSNSFGKAYSINWVEN